MAVLEFQFRWAFNGVQQQSVHYAVGDSLDASDLTNFGLQVRNQIELNLQTFFGIGWQMQPCRGRVVSVQGNPYTPINLTTFDGTGNLEELQLGHTLLLTFYRNAPAPNTKRVYFTGFTVGNMVNGVPANGIVAAVNALGDDLLAINAINGKPARYAVGRYTGSPAYMPTAFALETRACSTTFGHMESRER